ncbi:hypothetical protein G7046_g10066 [Stylonectria norvegica]|nr:hypothetical protein G7046_g10066 [Stylonectria norvegica]
MDNALDSKSPFTPDQKAQLTEWMLNRGPESKWYNIVEWVKENLEINILSRNGLEDSRRTGFINSLVAAVKEERAKRNALVSLIIYLVPYLRRQGFTIDASSTTSYLRLGSLALARRGESNSFPGFGMPLDHMPADHFPVLFGDRTFTWTAATLLIREVCMLKFVEDITNKPEWWIKVHDAEISANWKKEALEMPWTTFRKHADFTEKMADVCIDELREKARLYEKTDLIPVLDYSTCAIKSDRLIPADLKDALKAAVVPLEDVPASHKDWHPGSDGKVLDLVHPSLWPLLYGRSHILPDKNIDLNNCLEHCGMGVVVPIPAKDDNPRVNVPWYARTVESLSSRFQWLPCDVDLTGENPRIISYINNLHPVHHAALYPIIEKIIEKALPAWDVVYRWPKEFRVQRLVTKEARTDCSVPEICSYDCETINRPVNEDEDPREDDENSEDWYEGSERRRLDDLWYDETHHIILPDPKTDLADIVKLKDSDIKESGFFNGASRIQVIVKLASIHLTPENPTYDGGSWHVEGQVNEHICSTALYYYDCDNISDSQLDFRTPANAESLMEQLRYNQGDHDSIMRVFDIQSDGDTLQNIGSVLTREDRMLFFPNVLQHHVSPFSLADKTRPGHRKILALFLVDPAIPIISTARVPPQQKHWWAETSFPAKTGGRLPAEVTEMVMGKVDFPIDEEEAKTIRAELMAERSVLQDKTTTNIKHAEWNFCSWKLTTPNMTAKWTFQAQPDIFIELADQEHLYPNGKITTQPHLGLIPKQPYASDDAAATDQRDWVRLAAYVRSLNGSAPQGVAYKVLYLTRHGLGYHNKLHVDVGSEAWEVSAAAPSPS